MAEELKLDDLEIPSNPGDSMNSTTTKVHGIYKVIEKTQVKKLKGLKILNGLYFFFFVIAQSPSLTVSSV